MIPVWEHFEDLEEILYVADVETYELVYLNRYGRSVFRIEDEDNYAGKSVMRFCREEESHVHSVQIHS